MKHPRSLLGARIHVTLRTHAAPRIRRAITGEGNKNLEEDGVRTFVRFAKNEAGEIGALHVRWNFRAAERKQRWREVHVAQERVSLPATFDFRRPTQNARHANGFFPRFAFQAHALRAKHVGEHGDHAKGKQAGFLKGDILVEFDGSRSRRSETQLIATNFSNRRPGDHVPVKVLRDGREIMLQMPVQ